ncbi:MAG: riboflavin synthase [Candidatus Kerfeldbacteria bacterium]|nr:riboflavin synthase [Candidatus Kerfeldbacteria bacterium]
MKEGTIAVIFDGNFLNPEVSGFFNAMFTGIITHLGTVFSKTKTSLILKTDKDFLTGLEKGTSVAIDGICLTVVTSNKNSFGVNIMSETTDRTNIQYLQSGNLVNLELPTTPNSFLSGHIVQGHIDGTGRLQGIINKNNSYILKFSISNSLTKYVAEKGSIAVNGISLTVIKSVENYFTVGIIPHTWAKTMLHTIKVGNFVNVEVDIVAKYLEKLLPRK